MDMGPTPHVTWLGLTYVFLTLLGTGVGGACGFAKRMDPQADTVPWRRALIEQPVSMFSGTFLVAALMLLWEGLNPYTAILAGTLLSAWGRDGFDLLSSGAKRFGQKFLPFLFPPDKEQ